MAELTLDQQRAIALANARKRAQEGVAPQTGAVSSTVEAPSAVVDAAAALPSGVVRGAVETAMLPVTAKRIMGVPGNWLAGKLLGGGEALVRAAFGMSPASAETLAARQEAQNSLSAYDPVALGQDAVRAIMGNTLYEPKTTAGEYAGTIGEFMAPGGLPSKATRLAPTAARKAGEYAADVVRQAVVPAALSQGAGDIPGIQGTAAEPVAEVAGALLGNIGGALGKAASAPETVVRRAIGDPNKIDWPAAVGLQNNQTGVRLTGPEAIAQAMGGASALPNVMRVVEGSIDGGAVTAPFFAQRPAQIGTAVNSALDTIAPQSTAPSSLGPRVSVAAEQAIASSPEGQALADAIVGAGPRVTPLQAGGIIQPSMRAVYDRREGMRNALADRDYEAARRAEATIPVDGLNVSKTVRKPGYTRLEPGESPITGAPEMQPAAVPPRIETPAMTSRTGPDYIQVDARPVVQAIDRLSVDARADTARALGRVRNMLFVDGGVDTSVRGLDSARREIGDLISAAKRDGSMQAAERLLEVQAKLDAALADVPAYRSANEGFRAASAPLQPFESPGLGSVIERDQYGRGFTLPPERVPDALSSPSEARNFAAVAPDEARVAMGNRIATDLMDRVTDASGAVNADRLAQLLRDNADVLGAYPDVAQRLQDVVAASAQMPNARAGVMGQIAGAPDTAAVGNALLPRNPMVGSESEIGNAVARLMVEDPQAVPSIVRQNLADRFNTALTETQQGAQDFAGAKFYKDVAGNPQRAATLDAVLASMNNPEAQKAFPELLNVLQATGRRRPIGSATEFNRSINADLGAASPFARTFDMARSLGASWLANAGDAAKRAALRNSLGTLAEMFTDPNSVELIRAAAAKGAKTNLGEALMRAIAQSSASYGDAP